MEIQYQEHQIKDVLKYFVDGFEVGPGKAIHDYEAFVNTHNGRMVFKLYIKDADHKE